MQKAALYEAVNMIQLGAMPLPRFVALHPDAKVTPEELATLKAYLAPWAPSANRPGNSGGSTGGKTDAAPSAVSGSAPSPVSLASVHQEFNGIPFDPDFESWKMLSTTDRGDNNTFRFILGNDIAVRAAQSGNISPWPDGSRFAKIAWQQQPGADGIIHPGKFVQVELMIKDAHLYRNTEGWGWGWGRWRGLDLKPYGSDARFVNECTTCHLPVRGNDYVYTLPITAHQVSGEEIVNNRASLPASLPYQPLSWNAITMYVDPKTHTTATLFGNNLAMRSLKVRGGATAEMPVYPAGAVLALVTWVQREDPHWFGARIPDAPQSVEFVEVGSSTQTSHYGRYTGQGLAEDHVPPKEAAQRIGFVLNLSPARLP